MAMMAITVIQVLDITIANVALPHMRSGLGATMESSSWILTSFIMATAVAMPATGWLADRIGARRLYLLATAGFMISSAMCGAATSLEAMIVFRAMQGICAAFLQPLAQTLMFDIYPPSKQGKAMSAYGMIIMIAPVMGPMMGAVLTEHFSWRWVFYINLPIGLPAFALLWWLLPQRPSEGRKFDIAGFFTLAIALSALQLMLDRGQSQNWLDSTEIVIELLVFLAFGWIFLIHNAGARQPLFDRALYRNIPFLAGVICMIMIGIANVAVSSILPTMLQTLFGYDVVDTGLLMMPRALAVLAGMILTNQLIDKVDNRYLMAFGFVMAASGVYAMSGWSLGMDRTPIILAGMMQGFGIGFIFVPSTLVAFATVAPRLRPDGTSLLNLTRSIGSSIGISVMITYLTRNSTVAHATMAGDVTSFNLPAIDASAVAAAYPQIGVTALAAIDGEMMRQSLMLAYIDNFYALFWILIVFAPLMLLVPRTRSRRS